MNRRQFGLAMAAVGLTRVARAEPAEVEAIQLSQNGWMPTNDRLPVLWYHQAFTPAGDVAGTMEAGFASHGWPPQWRNGVYSFHHYHSTAHEVLGFAAGHAMLMLGGEGGRELSVQAGDVLVLPTGTGHCRLGASGDFLVIGAYPAGQHWDICRAAPARSAQERMATLPFPQVDPVQGGNGELRRHWLRPNA